MSTRIPMSSAALVGALLILTGCAAAGPATVPPTSPASSPTSDPSSDPIGSPSPAPSPPTDGPGVVLISILDPWTASDRPIALDIASGTAWEVPWGDTSIVWAPDGSAMATARRETRDLGDSRGPHTVSLLTVIPIDSTRAPIETEIEGRPSAWSPDGQAIAVSVDADGGPGGVLVVEPDGTELFRRPDANFVAWKPDSAGLLLSRLSDGILLLVDLPTREQKTLDRDIGSVMQAWDLATGPVWSPDGAALAYIGGKEDQGCRVCILDLETRAVRTVVARADAPPDQDFIPVAWSPSSGLFMVVAGERSRQLIRLDPATSVITPIADFDYITRPEISVDGRWLVFRSIDRDTSRSDLHLVATDTAAITVIAPIVAPWAGAPSWLPGPKPDSLEPLELVAPTPPPTAAASIDLDVTGALTFDGTVVDTCELADDGIRIESLETEVTVQLGLDPDGGVNFLAISDPGFLAFAGKGFEVQSPWVVVDAGATVSVGGLSFHDLPNASGGGTISGRLAWTCGLAAP